MGNYWIKGSPPLPVLLSSSPLRKTCVWSRGPAGYARSWQEGTYLPEARKEVSGQRHRKHGVGVPRCKKGAYIEKKQGQVLLQLESNLPCPRHFLTTMLLGLSFPRIQGFPNSWEEGQKTPPRSPALSSCGLPQLGAKAGTRVRKRSEGPGGEVQILVGSWVCVCGGDPQSCFFLMPPCPLTRVGVTPDSPPSPAKALLLRGSDLGGC